MNFALDGFFLNAVSAVTSRFSRSGGAGDPSSAVMLPDSVQRLDYLICSQLYQQSKFVQRIIDVYPTESGMVDPEFNSESNTIDTVALSRALRQLTVYNISESYRGTIPALKEASILSRLDGDGYLIIGVNDGQEFDQPVNESSIQSVDWLYCVSGNYLKRDATRRDYYQFSVDISSQIDDLKTTRYIHESRIIHLAGKKLPGELFRDNGHQNDSIMQAIFAEFVRFINSVNAGSSMLSSHSIFKYKLNGLKDLKGVQGQEALTNRFMNIMLGLNSIGGLFFDAQMEDAEFIQRQYNGVDTLTGLILDIFVAASDMPRSKLLGSSNSTSFSEGGESDRYEWAQRVKSWQVENWKAPLELLSKYVLLAQGQSVDDDFSVDFPSILQLTDKEVAELKKLYSESDTAYLNAGVLTALEVRESRFGGTDFNCEITLGELPVEPVEKPVAEDAVYLVNPTTNKIILPNNQVLPLSDYDRILESLEDEEND